MVPLKMYLRPQIAVLSRQVGMRISGSVVGTTQEFREFAVRSSAVDMVVGTVVEGAETRDFPRRQS